MIYTDPQPYAEAVAKLGERSAVGSVLTSAEWADVPLAVRERAFWSAQQTNLGFVARAKRGVDGLVTGTTDRATQRLELRKLAESLDLAPAGGDGSGTVSDLGSDARLNLILDTNLRQVQGYGNFKQGQEVAVLDQWPAQELFDTNPGATENRRDWAARWLAAGGTFFNGRMIALKSDPIWKNPKLSRFGTPYPPFDFGSYWDVQDVDRDTAVEAELISATEPAKSAEVALNADLEASLPEGGGEYARLLQDTFPDLIEIVGGVMKFIGGGAR